MDEASFSRLLDLVYDCALDASLWPRALEQMSDALHGGPAALLFQDQVSMLGTGVTVRLDPAALETHFQEYGRRNPLTAQNNVAALSGRLPIITDEDVLPKSKLMASEYYNEFYKPNGMHSALMMTLGVRGPSAATLNIMRAETAPQFDDVDIQFARNLQPHLARVFRLALRLAEARQAGGTLSEIMERSREALFLVGENGQVLRANSAGMAMLGDGLTIRQGELVASTPEASRRLRRLIDEATARWRETRQGGALMLPRPSQRRPLSIVVTPIGRDAVEVFDVGPAALVCASDPEAVRVRDAAMLEQLFGLTPAEIRVAERLMLGEGPEQAALATGIKLSTARWHLASLYRKTGTGRQAELVQLLLSLPVA